MADIVDTTVVTAVDVDGDGEFDIVHEVSATGVDIDGDGTIDEVEVNEMVAERDETEDDEA